MLKETLAIEEERLAQSEERLRQEEAELSGINAYLVRAESDL